MQDAQEVFHTKVPLEMGIFVIVGFLGGGTVLTSQGGGLGGRANLTWSLRARVGVGRVRSSTVGAGGCGGFARCIWAVGLSAVGALWRESAGGAGVSERHASSTLEGLGARCLGGFAAVVTEEEGEAVCKEVVNGRCGFCSNPEHGGWGSGCAALDAPRGEGLQVLELEGVEDVLGCCGRGYVADNTGEGWGGLLGGVGGGSLLEVWGQL